MIFACIMLAASTLLALGYIIYLKKHLFEYDSIICALMKHIEGEEPPEDGENK